MSNYLPLPGFENIGGGICTRVRTCGESILTDDDARGNSDDGAVLLVLDHAGDAAVGVVEVAVTVDGASGTTCRSRSIAYNGMVERRLLVSLGRPFKALDCTPRVVEHCWSIVQPTLRRAYRTGCTRRGSRRLRRRWSRRYRGYRCCKSDLACNGGEGNGIRWRQ